MKFYGSGLIKSNLHSPELSVSSIEDRLDEVTYWKIEAEEAWK